jgi:hypothetical protein
MADKKEEPVKPAAADEKDTKPHPASTPLPVMIDFSLSVSKLLVLLVGLMTVIVSVFSGATPPMTALRGGMAMFTVGLCVWAFNWLLSRNSLELARQDLMREMEAAKARQQENEKASSTVEISA